MWTEAIALLTVSSFCWWRCARWYFPFVARMRRGTGLRAVLAFLGWIAFSGWFVTTMLIAVRILHPPLSLGQTLLLCMLYAFALIPVVTQIPKRKF